MNADKLKTFIHSLSGGKVSKRFYNMRLAPEAVSGVLGPLGFDGPVTACPRHAQPMRKL